MLPNNKLSYIILSITFIIFLGATIFGLRYFFGLRESKEQSPVVDATKATDDQILDLVGKHLVLPLENPKIVTIENVEDLRSQQPFFTQANNGDKLLVYSTKVILYDPTIDKVVDIAQIRIDTSPTPVP